MQRGADLFHCDPFGNAMICKVARTSSVALVDEGLPGLLRLGMLADQQLARTGVCSGCRLIDRCWTCPPLARQFRASGAPRGMYCEAGRR